MNLEKSPVTQSIEQYPEDVQRAAGYIATQLAAAHRYRRISQILPAGFRRNSMQHEAEMTQQRAIGASEVLNMQHTPPPDAETWLDALRP